MQKQYKVVLSVAGSDSSGGAGIQADLKTFSALGVFGATAITALTAQNTLGVKAIFAAPADFVKQQIELVFEDLNPIAVKIGMLHSPEIVETVADCIEKYKPKYTVLDPVMVASSGDKLIQNETIKTMIDRLFPLANIITPNLDEAGILLGRKIQTLEEMKIAEVDLFTLGCCSVLLKGGHLDGDMVYDVFQETIDKQHIFTSEKITTLNTHGTGCTLSSALAAFLAKGYGTVKAVEEARTYVYNALKAGKDVSIGKGCGAVNHFFNPQILKSE